MLSIQLYLDFVQTSRWNHFKCLQLAVYLATYLLAAGCAARKTPPPPPSPTYPPAPESALLELRGVPTGQYDRLEIITVEAEVGERLASATKSARESAAQKGATAIVVLQDTEFPQKIGNRRLWVRRITYLAIHRR
jgi:hypothetical protein